MNICNTQGSTSHTCSQTEALQTNGPSLGSVSGSAALVWAVGLAQLPYFGQGLPQLSFFGRSLAATTSLAS